jgi:hypothetical protein
MSLKFNAKALLYFLIVVLSVIALALAADSPSFGMDNKAVYEGF